ncbi:MAG: LpxL/LpxP family Kdo(2)-lipid IV(A) lauroyl/palmitoleoyl acyltransferase [Pseudomonadales bacterium]|nr:LpxL/LpxP family Kdo(2)-lipid IV(A) lauroyl/palmitoleoyl acyltransferase [Pseudomonadales bacterium]
MRLKYQQIPLSEKPKDPLHPRNWPVWAASAGMYLLSRPNLKTRTRIGKTLGHLSYHIAHERRKIAETNINACFPELSAQERKTLVKKTLVENVVGVVETAAAWWRSPKEFLQYTEFYGTENLLKPLADGQGVLLIGGHYTTLDMGGALLSLITNYDVTYRANNDPTIDWMIRKGREQFTSHQIERTQIRSIFKALREGRVLWYAPDQDYGSKRSVFAPFFSIPTATIKATSKFSAQPNTKVLFISHFRKKDDSGYAVFFSPPLENFPTGNEAEDARIVNEQLEKEIRRVPEQYMWVHRRFKSRPEGEQPFYK